MVTLRKLNVTDAGELCRRLNQRWRNSPNNSVACRRYRMMLRVFRVVPWPATTSWTVG